ncbi:MAG: hypothetical protein ACYTXY_04375, partial [Nostoc sp.]
VICKKSQSKRLDGKVIYRCCAMASNKALASSRNASGSRMMLVSSNTFISGICPPSLFLKLSPLQDRLVVLGDPI